MPTGKSNSNAADSGIIDFIVDEVVIAFFRDSKQGKDVLYVQDGKMYVLPKTTAAAVAKGNLVITQWEEGEVLTSSRGEPLLSCKPVMSTSKRVDSMLSTLEIIRNQQITEQESAAMLNMARIRRELA